MAPLRSPLPLLLAALLAADAVALAAPALAHRLSPAILHTSSRQPHLVMLAKNARRAARRAKKAAGQSTPPATAQPTAAPAAGPTPTAPQVQATPVVPASIGSQDVPVVSAVPVTPADSSVPVVQAVSVTPAQPSSDAATTAGATASQSQVDDVLVSQDLSQAFQQSQTTIADVLPTFDDFRRRDEQEAQRVNTQLDLPPTPGSYKTRPEEPKEQTVQDKMLTMLTFDGIDDRPVNEDPYDAFDRLIGKGLPNKAGAYTLPYLQTGHMLIILVLLLSGLVSYPGFPLTEVPDEYRALIWQGMGITLLINTAAAVYSRGIAQAKEQPVTFWFIKIFFLGGLALGELKEAVPEPAAVRNAQWRASQKNQKNL